MSLSVRGSSVHSSVSFIYVRPPYSPLLPSIDVLASDPTFRSTPHLEFSLRYAPPSPVSLPSPHDFFLILNSLKERFCPGWPILSPLQQMQIVSHADTWGLSGVPLSTTWLLFSFSRPNTGPAGGSEAPVLPFPVARGQAFSPGIPHFACLCCNKFQ